jgi:hypothetical protein
MNKYIRHKEFIVNTEGIRSVAVEGKDVKIFWENSKDRYNYSFDTDIAANDFFNILGNALNQPTITYSKV